MRSSGALMSLIISIAVVIVGLFIYNHSFLKR